MLFVVNVDAPDPNSLLDKNFPYQKHRIHVCAIVDMAHGSNGGQGYTHSSLEWLQRGVYGNQNSWRRTGDTHDPPPSML